ncbi:MAG: hypothetical protein NT076_04930 [Candidatus Pacearchaeota archaeon]|nr:hypothetical protein [Candidatus Pacearchaeota archaeon]
MKKLVLVLAMLSLVGGFTMAINSLPIATLVGDEPTQFTLTPTTLDFGTLIPGGASGESTDTINFTVNSGNQDITLTVTDVTTDIGNDLFKLIDLSKNAGGNWADIMGFSETVLCTSVSDVCTYPTSLIWDARLAIPAKTIPGTKTGTIVYTVTGQVPV